MRRALTLSALLVTVLVLPTAASDAPPAALQLTPAVACPTALAAPSPLAPLAPLEPGRAPTTEELLRASGLVPIDPVAADTLPDCPTVNKCPSGPYNSCTGTNCGTVDTGYEACQSASGSFSCLPGQTIHVTSCQCTTDFQARCCTTFPACICVKCSAFTSHSISCQ